MEDLSRSGSVGELNLASRRAEDAALRRYQAVYWLDYLVGPLGIRSQPSEKEFISCLRNGLILCNVINKVQPNSVTKVIEMNSPPASVPWYSQQLPAYQYFENVRNFLAAAEQLKLPIFEASIFEKETLQEGASTKVVDCILALKAYHEWKQMTGGIGIYRPPRSPLGSSAKRIHAGGLFSHCHSRKLDTDGGANRTMPSESNISKLEERIVKAFANCMVESKENMDHNLFSYYHERSADSMKHFSKILLSCLEEHFEGTYHEMKSSILDYLREQSCSRVHSPTVPLADISSQVRHECCRACSRKSSCNHWNVIEQKEKELLNIKLLLSTAKQEVESLQSLFQNDLKQLGVQVLEMSTAALGYQKAVQENRNLYNMVQDLKGNIRVYCRIRPACDPCMQNVVDYIGDDGCLAVVDPKHKNDGKKMFHFNHVFGPIATQKEVFKETQPLIRSVMDGYNVCIFAYGQTGSGKTHTMLGSPGRSSEELGISYLTISDLFQLSHQRKDVTKYEFQVQMVEIYNEQVYDLLAEASDAKKLEIRRCASEDSMVFPNVTAHSVTSAVDAMNLIKLGEVNLAFSATSSSHSHSIMSVHVHGEDVSGNLLHSCLHLVDLAGSEQMDMSEVTGRECEEEAEYPNKSLVCFIDVITALAQKNSHIPYQNSKLTLLLQNALGGNAKTLMLAHVNPSHDSFGETMSTLKFAQRVSMVELGAARTNKESSDVLELKAQIEMLKKALGEKEIQIPKSARTPSEKHKQTIELTPPRPRRLSIENGNTMALEGSRNPDEKRCAKSPFAKAKQASERTPPRPRRLSIENGNEGPRERVVKDHHDGKRLVKTPVATAKLPSDRTPPPRSRRLSLENGNRIPPHKLRSSVKACSPISNLQRQRHGLEDAEAGPLKNCGQLEDGNLIRTRPGEMESKLRAPLSPVRIAPLSPVMRIDTASIRAAASLQVPRTPESQMYPRNEILQSMPSDSNLFLEIEKPFSTQAKGSHIRKSLRTMGKLISGSEKRNPQKLAETTLHAKHDAKSPVSSKPKALRRQSITGITPPERSRRSSLGGVSTDSCRKETREAKTPPPQVRFSIKSTKRWL